MYKMLIVSLHYYNEKKNRERGLTRSASARRRGGDGIDSAQHCVKTKDVRYGFYCCYVRCATLTVSVRGM